MSEQPFTKHIEQDQDIKYLNTVESTNGNVWELQVRSGQKVICKTQSRYLSQRIQALNYIHYTIQTINKLPFRILSVPEVFHGQMN